MVAGMCVAAMEHASSIADFAAISIFVVMASGKNLGVIWGSIERR